MSIKNALLATAAAAAFSLAAVPASAEKFITIGTGGQTGVHYQVGGAICKLVNRGTKKHGIKCTHTTGGSTKNINGIRAADLIVLGASRPRAGKFLMGPNASRVVRDADCSVLVVRG